MTDPTFMSASDLRREVVRLREGIRQHRQALNPTASRWLGMQMDRELWDLLDEDDG